MGITVEINGAGVDWPAWVQAIGSIAAIVAAVLIDRGLSRRAEKTRKAEHVARIAEWRSVLDEVVRALGTAESEFRRLDLENADLGPSVRELANAQRLVDLYLAQEPPNPRVGRAMVQMRTELDAPLQHIRDFSLSRSYPDAVMLEHLLKDAVSKVTDARDRYARGL